MHTITAPNGATLPVDERADQQRTDELAAYTRAVLEDRAALRPRDPPRFIEPPDFLYQTELCQRLAPWYPDWGELAALLRLLAVRTAYLHGRPEVSEEDWQVLARVARDTVPGWIRRGIEHLRTAPGQHSSHLLLARAM